MIFLIVVGGIMLILSAFYLWNSIQRYGSWVWGSCLVVISALMVGIGLWVMVPQWLHPTTTTNATSAASSGATSSSSSSATLSVNNTGLTGQTKSQSEYTTSQSVLKQLQSSLKSFGNVTYDEATKTYMVHPTSDNTVKALDQIVSDPSTASAAGWSNLTSSFTKISKQLSSAMGTGYSISITEPDDQTKAMFTVKDGTTTYDIAN